LLLVFLLQQAYLCFNAVTLFAMKVSWSELLESATTDATPSGVSHVVEISSNEPPAQAFQVRTTSPRNQ
jgi:hypothetical protein